MSYRAHTTENGTTGKLFRWMLTYWLKKNRFYYDEICYCSEKDSSTDKLDVCRTQKIDVMIDDKPENLLALKGELKVLCYNAVWNQSMNDTDIVRVNDWSEIEAILSRPSS